MQEDGDDEGVTVVHTPLDVVEAIDKLHGDTDIEYAEPNYIVTGGRLNVRGF